MSANMNAIMQSRTVANAVAITEPANATGFVAESFANTRPAIKGASTLQTNATTAATLQRRGGDGAAYSIGPGTNRSYGASEALGKSATRLGVCVRSVFCMSRK